MRVTKESIDRLFDYDVHVETRTIYIGDSTEGELDYLTAKNTIKALHILQSFSIDRPINVILNTFGGCWYNGMAIYDAVRGCPCHVVVTAIGAAMSMGSIILQAADERVIYPNATLMIHDGYETRVDDAPNTFQNWAEHSKVCQARMYAIYSERSGKQPGFWKRKCASDSILTAEKAVEIGLADRIFKPPVGVANAGM